MVAFLFILIIMVSIATGIMSATWNSPEIKGSWYIPFANGLTAQQTVKGFITILILLNNYVPISLYVSMEAKILKSTFYTVFIAQIYRISISGSLRKWCRVCRLTGT